MLWTQWSGASSGILLTMSSQACMEKDEGSARERVAICLWFCKILLSAINLTTLIYMPFVLAVYSITNFSLVLGPMGCRFDVSRLDTSTPKKELVTWPPGGSLDRDLDQHTSLARKLW